MAKLEFSDIFGSNYALEIDDPTNTYEARINLADFRNTADGGEINNGLGITDIVGDANSYQPGGNKAPSLLYAFILLLSQNQATGVNDDPDQKIYVSEGGLRFATGTRAGQIERRITVSFFSEQAVTNLPDIDDV